MGGCRIKLCMKQGERAAKAGAQLLPTTRTNTHHENERTRTRVLGGRASADLFYFTPSLVIEELKKNEDEETEEQSSSDLQCVLSVWCRFFFLAAACRPDRLLFVSYKGHRFLCRPTPRPFSPLSPFLFPPPCPGPQGPHPPRQRTHTHMHRVLPCSFPSFPPLRLILTSPKIHNLLC